MTDIVPACFIGLDMGTTNTRAWRVEAGKIVAVARTPIGIRDAATAGHNGVLRQALARLVEELSASQAPPAPPPRFIVAAGMITSGLGLAEVAHVPAPAGVEELAGGARRLRAEEAGDLDVYLLPGVSTGPPHLDPEDIAAADVMRGEETLCVGLHSAGLLPAGATLLNLGSHWKAIPLDADGRVAGSITSLAGELLHAAQTRTILAGSVPGGRPGDLDPRWVALGRTEARRTGLERALFCVRLLEQRTGSSAQERLAYLVGAFVGSSLRSLLGALAAEGPVVVAGGGALPRIFAAALAEEGREARVLSSDQVEQGMVRGLSLIAHRAMQHGW